MLGHNLLELGKILAAWTVLRLGLRRLSEGISGDRLGNLDLGFDDGCLRFGLGTV